MACLKPIAIKVKQANYVTDKGTDGMITVPCGYCHKCRAKKRRDWSYRLEIEAENAKFGRHFITLTYADHNIPFITELGDTVRGIDKMREYAKAEPKISFQQSLIKKDVQLFLKKVRRFQDYHYREKLSNLLEGSVTPKVRFFLCGEYGSKTSRPHYHILLFNALPKTVEALPKLWSYKTGNGDIIPRGITHVGKITPASIKYVCKYILKSKVEKNKYVIPEFTLMSRGSKKEGTKGIGYQFFTSEKARYNLNNSTLLVRNHNNKWQIMPKYYRDKLFPDSDRKIKAYENLVNELNKIEIADDDRIEKLGQDVGYYRLDQIRAFINKQEKTLHNTKF